MAGKKHSCPFSSGSPGSSSSDSSTELTYKLPRKRQFIKSTFEKWKRERVRTRASNVELVMLQPATR